MRRSGYKIPKQKSCHFCDYGPKNRCTGKKRCRWYKRNIAKAGRNSREDAAWKQDEDMAEQEYADRSDMRHKA